MDELPRSPGGTLSLRADAAAKASRQALAEAARGVWYSRKAACPSVPRHLTVNPRTFRATARQAERAIPGTDGQDPSRPHRHLQHGNGMQMLWWIENGTYVSLQQGGSAAGVPLVGAYSLDELVRLARATS